MRRIGITLLTAGYFTVALLSYGQVAAQDETVVTPREKPCRVIDKAEAERLGLSPGTTGSLSSSVTVGGGSASASTSTGSAASGVTVQSSGGSTSSSTVTTGNGQTVVTGSGDCVIITDD